MNNAGQKIEQTGIREQEAQVMAGGLAIIFKNRDDQARTMPKEIIIIISEIKPGLGV